MKNNLDKVFINKRPLLNVFCTAGFPQRDSIKEVILSLQENGVDMIEIGMPYSDPIADGPLIQESNQVALHNGMTLDLLFEQLREIRTKVEVPLILMGYFNPLLQYGVEDFCSAAADAGVSGVIVPDLPQYEYEKLYKAIFQKHGLHFIFLVTPGISKERLKQADKASSGFLYAVSSTATTGGATPDMDASLAFLKKTKLNNPVMVGFGIKDRLGYEAACRHAAGAIIGSAYIKALQINPVVQQATTQFIKSIRP